MGWFTKKKIEGTSNDAIHFIRSGQIELGQKLLWQLCGDRSGTLSPLVFGALEFYRDPTDRDKCSKINNWLSEIPGCAEYHAMTVMAGAFNYSKHSIELVLNAFQQMNRHEAYDAEGAALCLWSELAIADLRIQCICRPNDDAISSVWVTPLIKVVANFLLRADHQQTIQLLNEINAPEQIKSYQKFFQFPLSKEQQHTIGQFAEATSLLGRGLMLRDLMKYKEAKRLFKTYQNRLGFDKKVELLVNELIIE